MDGRSDQTGYFHNHGTYDQMVAGIQPGDSYGTAQWKLQSHYSTGGRDATGASLYSAAPAPAAPGAYASYPACASDPFRLGAGPVGSASGAAPGGSPGGFAARPPPMSPAARAVVRALVASAGAAALAVLFAAQVLAPAMTQTDGLKTLPDTRFFSTQTLGPSLRGFAALDVLPGRALGEAAARALRLAPEDPRALAVGAAALHRIERGAAFGQVGVSGVALEGIALRFLDEEARQGSADAAIDRGLWEASRMTYSYHPSRAMYRWGVAERRHPDDPRVKAVLAQYRRLFGFELVRIKARDWARPFLPPGSLPD